MILLGKMTLSDSTDQPPPQPDSAVTLHADASVAANPPVAADVSNSPDTGHAPDTGEFAGTLSKTATSEVLGFRPQDRRMMTVLTTALLLWLTVEWIVVATRRPDPLLLKRGAEFHASFRVNVNESLWVDWMQLEGIGPSLAQRIVADRNVNGLFSSIEDVSRVPGIGPATLDRIRPWLTMGHDENKTSSGNASSQRRSKPQPATNERQPTTL